MLRLIQLNLFCFLVAIVFLIMWALSLSLMNYVFMITESYVRVITNYCVALFTDNKLQTCLIVSK